MKFLPRLFCLSFALGSTLAIAQLPSAGPVQHSLMLDVETMSAGGSTKTTGLPQGIAGTSTQTRDHTTTLQITIKNFGKAADQVDVEWYFIGRQTTNHHDGKDFVFDSGNKTITVQPAGFEKFAQISKAAQTAKVTTTKTTMVNVPSAGGVSRQVADSSTTESEGGTRLVGWVVRILADGKVLDARGSDFKYEDIAKDPDKFAAL